MSIDYKKLVTNVLKGNLGTFAKVQAISTVVNLYTGRSPIINETSKYTEIKFTPDQVKTLQDTLKKWHDAEPGDIRIDVQPVLLPFYLKKYAPYIGGAVGIGFIIGFLIKSLK